MGHSKHMQVQRSSPWDRARSGFGEASKKSNRGWSNELCWRLLSGSWHDCQVRTDNQQEIQTGAIDRQFNRDFQDEAKKKGHPWTLAKVRYSHWRETHGFKIQMFDTSLPVSPLIPLDALPDPHNVTLWCKVKTGQCKLCGQADHCRWTVSSGKRATPRIWSSHCQDLFLTYLHTLPWVSVKCTRSLLYLQLFRRGRFDSHRHPLWGWPGLWGRCDNWWHSGSYGDRVRCCQESQLEHLFHK